MCDNHEDRQDAALDQLDSLIRSIDQQSLTLSQLVETYRVSITEIMTQEALGNDALGVNMGVEMGSDHESPTTLHLHTELATEEDAEEAEACWEICVPFIKATLADRKKQPEVFDYQAFEDRLGCGYVPGDPMYPLLKQLKAITALGPCVCNVIFEDASAYVVSVLVNQHVVNIKVCLDTYLQWQVLQAAKRTTH